MRRLKEGMNGLVDHRGGRSRRKWIALESVIPKRSTQY
jgi:hypothetical protein